MREDAPRTPLRPSAVERREQLLRVASRIIETEGVEALRPTRVAKLAGCTRPLIYQYFPRREDFFIALTEELYKALDATWTPEEQVDVVPAAYRGDEEPARSLLGGLWDYIGRAGPAALILRTAPEISNAYSVYLANIRDLYEQRWLLSFAKLGLNADQTELMLETFIMITKVLAVQLLAGRIDRPTAIDRHIAATSGLLSRFVSPSAV